MLVVVLVRKENYERIGGKKRNTSKEKYLEAKKERRELFTRPKVKQKGKDSKRYVGGWSEMLCVEDCKEDGEN